MTLDQALQLGEKARSITYLKNHLSEIENEKDPEKIIKMLTSLQDKAILKEGAKLIQSFLTKKLQTQYNAMVSELEKSPS